MQKNNFNIHSFKIYIWNSNKCKNYSDGYMPHYWRENLSKVNFFFLFKALCYQSSFESSWLSIGYSLFYLKDPFATYSLLLLWFFNQLLSFILYYRFNLFIHCLFLFQFILACDCPLISSWIIIIYLMSSYQNISNQIYNCISLRWLNWSSLFVCY